MQDRYDVFGIGNAIVDTEVQVDDLLLTTHGLEKGIMTLVSTETQLALLDGLAGYDQHGAAGGSAGACSSLEEAPVTHVRNNGLNY